MKKLGFSWLLWVGVAAMISSGCRKDPLANLTSEESRVYVTNRDTTVNFSSYHSFSIVDSVAFVNNDNAPKRTLTQADAAMIAAIKAQMQQRGYVLVDKSQRPDLGINVTRISNSYVGLVSTPGYWSTWPGYWDPFYWGYPGYGYYFPTFYSYYRYREGSWVIDMIDLKNADKSGNALKAIWNAQIRGDAVLSSSTVENSVKALFDQSAYLKAGG